MTPTTTTTSAPTAVEKCSIDAVAAMIAVTTSQTTTASAYRMPTNRKVGLSTKITSLRDVWGGHRHGRGRRRPARVAEPAPFRNVGAAARTRHTRSNLQEEDATREWRSMLSSRPMRFAERACVMDAARMNRAISRCSRSRSVERNLGVEGLVLVGVQRRWVPLAERIAERIGELEGKAPQVATIDIAFYGDDLSLLAPTPIVRESPMPAELDGATVVIVDDVLYTGRTVYAALAHLLTFGRPRRVRARRAIDRGHRELPFQADYIGRSCPRSARRS